MAGGGVDESGRLVVGVSPAAAAAGEGKASSVPSFRDNELTVEGDGGWPSIREVALYEEPMFFLSMHQPARQHQTCDLCGAASRRATRVGAEAMPCWDFERSIDCHGGLRRHSNMCFCSFGTLPSVWVPRDLPGSSTRWCRSHSTQRAGILYATAGRHGSRKKDATTTIEPIKYEVLRVD
jgi:hypothetical protein